MHDISLEQIEKARKVIQKNILYSPLIPLRYQDETYYLKAENLQPSGSFKIRGATYAMDKITTQQRKNGVIAYSTGNHAQAVALAAKRLGLKATIVMSPGTMPFKVEATLSYGATVVMIPPDQRHSHAEELAKTTGALFIPPFESQNIITGQGTIGLEILDVMEPSIVFVPVGGGGLISGIAIAIKEKCPTVKIVGVEPVLENDAWQSFHKKKLIRGKNVSDTIADAVKIPQLGEMTYAYIQHYVDDMIQVSEEQIAQATVLTIEASHLFVEPSGALALAGALSYPNKSNKPIVCIASGGNTTLSFLNGIQKI